MEILLYYFNHELRLQVERDLVAPSGYYSEIVIRDSSAKPMKLMYYRGLDFQDEFNRPDVKFQNSFEVSDEMTILKYT